MILDVALEDRDAEGLKTNAIWRTQVFRAILERRRVLESERGSAGVTRETRKRKDVVGVRLEPRDRQVEILSQNRTKCCLV